MLSRILYRKGHPPGLKALYKGNNPLKYVTKEINIHFKHASVEVLVRFYQSSFEYVFSSILKIGKQLKNQFSALWNTDETKKKENTTHYLILESTHDP